MTRVQLRHRITVADVLVGICVIASVASPWSISIPPAHVAESFGFQTLLCWLTVIALLAALLLDRRAAVLALALAELVLAGWFGWAMWIVTTSRFTALPFPFVGTDLIGPGWYAAAVGLLLAAGAFIKTQQDRDLPVGYELWILAAIPGYGLVRFGRWFHGLIWTVLVSGALYLGSTDSPDPAQFVDYGRSGNVPPPLPRWPEYVLLGVAAALWVVSIGLTVWQRRQHLEHAG